MLRTILRLCAGCVALLLSPAAARADANLTQFNLGGAVNGFPISAAGTITYGPGNPTPMHDDIIFAPINLGSSFHPAYIGSSIRTVWCNDEEIIMGSIGHVTDGEFNFQRTIVARDQSSNIVAQFLLTGSHTTPSTGNSTMNATISGNSSGPTDFTGVDGYEQFFHQLGPGQIESSYVQTLHRSGGATIGLTVNTLWTYAGPRVLPNDEYSILDINSFTFNAATGRLLVDSTGHYVPEPATLLVLAVASPLLLLRRRT